MPKLCPMLKEPCIEHGCAWYKHILGLHPQTGAELDHFECAVTLQNELLIENGRQQRQTGAAVESLRNEVAKHGVRQVLLKAEELIQASDKAKIIDGRAGE